MFVWSQWCAWSSGLRRKVATAPSFPGRKTSRSSRKMRLCARIFRALWVRLGQPRLSKNGIILRKSKYCEGTCFTEVSQSHLDRRRHRELLWSRTAVGKGDWKIPCPNRQIQGGVFQQSSATQSHGLTQSPQGKLHLFQPVCSEKHNKLCSVSSLTSRLLISGSVVQIRLFPRVAWMSLSRDMCSRGTCSKTFIGWWSDQKSGDHAHCWFWFARVRVENFQRKGLSMSIPLIHLLVHQIGFWEP